MKVTQGPSCSPGTNIMDCSKIMSNNPVNSNSVLTDLPSTAFSGQIINCKNTRNPPTWLNWSERRHV
eukprot:UN00156